MPQMFRIGINVFVIRDGKLLLQKRTGGYGAGEWGLPGGHLEYGESFRGAAARELMEETGITASGFEFENIVNQPHRDDGEHAVQIAFRAIDPAGEPENREPEHCETMEWFDPDELPEPLMGVHVEQIRLFFEKGRFVE